MRAELERLSKEELIAKHLNLVAHNQKVCVWRGDGWEMSHVPHHRTNLWSTYSLVYGGIYSLRFDLWSLTDDDGARRSSRWDAGGEGRAQGSTVGEDGCPRGGTEEEGEGTIIYLWLDDLFPIVHYCFFFIHQLENWRVWGIMWWQTQASFWAWGFCSLIFARFIVWSLISGSWCLADL